MWSGDVARGLRVAERIDAGQVAVNGGALTIETPFGGFKQSGYGREKGLEALHEYAQTKTISLVARLSGGAQWRRPSDLRAARAMRRVDARRRLRRRAGEPTRTR